MGIEHRLTEPYSPQTNSIECDSLASLNNGCHGSSIVSRLLNK